MLLRKPRAAILPALLGAMLLAGGLAGCTTNPVTGEESFTAFMPPSEEARVGREQDPLIRQQFGGVYDDAAVVHYVDGIGLRLMAVTEQPGQSFSFTVLNTPTVNAFALPGGYVYVTRGLVALADTEAELAGVLAHEIGHVTARHSAERYSRAVVGQIGASLLGVLANSRAVADLASMGAGLYVQSYSRDQEFQADTLGIRYLTRAGYDPDAMASFLAKLGAYADLEAEIAGRGSEAERFNLMSTHPRTVDRIELARSKAAVVPVARPTVGRDAHLHAIDGLLFGDDPDQGLVRGRTFAHPALGFTFDAPPEYALRNEPSRVVGIGPDGARMIFDRAPGRPNDPPLRYLTRDWAEGGRVDGVEAYRANGLEAATGFVRTTVDSVRYDLRLVAIRFTDGAIYRFVYLVPTAIAARHAEGIRRSALSFRPLSRSEVDAMRPFRIRVVTVAEGDTVSSLASRMPEGPLAERRFRVLNGIGPEERLVPGRKVKIVTE